MENTNIYYVYTKKKIGKPGNLHLQNSREYKGLKFNNDLITVNQEHMPSKILSVASENIANTSRLE